MFELDLGLLLFLSVLTGFFVSATDFLVDEKRRTRLAFAPALFYAASAIVLLASNPVFASVYLAMLAGVFFAGKIDSGPHKLAVVIVLLFVLFKQPFLFDELVFLLLALACFADEWLHERKWSNGVLRQVSEKRLLLEGTALSYGFYSSQWLYFFAIACFDAGYVAARRMLTRF